MNQSWPELFEEEKRFLTWIDYFVFSLTLLISFVVGIYFGLSKNRAHTTEEYLLGGRNVSVLPIALSLIATNLSATIIIAVPADIYKFGSNFVWTILGDITAFLATLFIFLPIFFKLQVVSIFEYLELRFHKNVRTLTSVLNLVAMLSYAPVVVYIPALSMSQVSGVEVHFIVVTISVVCILYTTVGGFKAVIWTDVLQFSVILGSVLAILVIGLKSVGGLGNAMSAAAQTQRWDIFDTSVDFTIRNSLWGPLLGNAFTGLSIVAVNQTCVQKYLALLKFSDIKRCIFIHLLGIIVMKAVVILLGNVIYAKYAECDVFRSQKIAKTDEMVPYFVNDITKDLPGLTGFFFAGILSAALSSLSSSLNGTAASLHRDLILPFTSDMSQQKNTNIIKAVVTILGVICILLALLVGRVGGIFPFVTAILSISGGPLAGVFILAILFPCANTKGALIGSISGVTVTAWMVLGNTWYRTHNLLPNEDKPMSSQKCNVTSLPTNVEDNVFVLYKISFWYYSIFSTLIVVVVGLTISWLTKQRGIVVNTNLLSPFVHRFLSKDLHSPVYYIVNTESVTVNVTSKDTEDNRQH